VVQNLGCTNAATTSTRTQDQRPSLEHKGSLARVLGDAAVSAGGTDTFLGEPYRRIARRPGKKRAIVAGGRSILVIAWHLLSDDTIAFHDLGPDYCDSRVNLSRKMRNHVRELQALGYKVTLEAAA
jgi:transposase